MRVYFDGGLKKNLMAIVNGGTNYTIITKREYDNNDYEWDALELALIYALTHQHKDEVWLFNDNNQVIRWMYDNLYDTSNIDSVIKDKCLTKIRLLQETATVIPQWVPRERNLAGRVLEYHTSHSRKPKKFIAEWFECRKCAFRSLSKRDREHHYYNEHVTNG